MVVFLFLFVSKEISLKEQLLEKMEKDLDVFKRKFSVILHQKVAMPLVSTKTFLFIIYSRNSVWYDLSLLFVNIRKKGNWMKSRKEEMLFSYITSARSGGFRKYSPVP